MPTATPPPFASAAPRSLSPDAARAVLNRIERQRRDEELRELRGQLDELRWRRGIVATESERRAIDSLITRCEAYIARATGEAVS
jgi:hypothetical protein